MRVLIVESGFTRGALAACRALADAGWTVGIGSPDRHGLAASSRHAARWHEVPPVEQNLDAFLLATEAAVIAGGYEAIFCAEDAFALGLSFGRDRLSAVVPYPPHEVVVRAIDKLDLHRAARAVGMPSPATRLADEEAISQIDRPTLVKARLHWTPGARAAPSRMEAEICSDEHAVRRRVTTIRQHGGDPVLQEIVRGRLVHYLVFVGETSEVIAGVQTLAEPLFYPGPDIGQRVRSISTPVDEALRRQTGALMRELRWVGMASLNLLLPLDDGELTLIDFNGRYGASFDQYIAAGSNFPAMWACQATNRPLPSIAPVKVGVRFQWLEGDVRRALKQRRGGLLHDVTDCLLYARGAVHTLWRRNDPLPTIRFASRLGRQAYRKLRRTETP